MVELLKRFEAITRKKDGLAEWSIAWKDLKQQLQIDDAKAIVLLQGACNTVLRSDQNSPPKEGSYGLLQGNALDAVAQIIDPTSPNT